MVVISISVDSGPNPGFPAHWLCDSGKSLNFSEVLYLHLLDRLRRWVPTS